MYDGPAGSGKTTRLFEDLGETLEESPIIEGQRVLALTRMHGSRRRMQGRLATLPILGGLYYSCETMDRFAWRLSRRWRSLASARGIVARARGDYGATCRAAGALLTEREVQDWVLRAFPIVVIDELQDSKDGQLEIVKGLSSRSICIAAADWFQDLDASEENEAVNWAHCFGDVVSLTRNRRTSAAGLLAAARALREGSSVVEKGSGFRILGALNPNVGASFLANNIHWWAASGDIAVITPVRSENSPFVRRVLRRVREKPIGKEKRGPYKVPWEFSHQDRVGRVLEHLELPQDSEAEVDVSVLMASIENRTTLDPVREWLGRQRRVAGRRHLSVREILEEVALICQRQGAHAHAWGKRVRAMTVHQAKNREFESVIVLWPYEAAGSPERVRRLLYNAVTRAKRQAVVIVQDPKRLKQIPFVGSAK